MKLIVGLGNVGQVYESTPHNIGWRVADALAAKMGLRLRPAGSVKALVGKGRLGGQETMLAKPTTFMNLSGQAVAPIAFKKRVSSDNIIVLVDDADLPLGSLRWRCRGGDGGHKGLRSIIAELGCDDFVRLRIGVCPAERPGDLEAYVLTPFPAPMREWIDRIAQTAADSVALAMSQGIETAANHFNGKIIERPKDGAMKNLDVDAELA